MDPDGPSFVASSMSFRLTTPVDPNPAVTRLGRLTELSEREVEALLHSLSAPRHVRSHRDLLLEGRAVPDPTILVWGWAARVRQFSDGRRQLLSFLLPGDLIGICRQRDARAATSIVAITDVGLCAA